MERVFSVEEISDPFWAPPPAAAASASGDAGGAEASALSRCPSEWYFQKFLEEAGRSSPSAHPSPNPSGNGSCAGNGRRAGKEGVVEASPQSRREVVSAVVDPVEYNAMLKQKLEKDLAAFAMWRASGAMPPESSVADSSPANSDSSQIGLNYATGNEIPVQNKLSGAPGGGSGPFVHNADVPVKQATSSSSREPSDDDDMEGEAETMENMNPTDDKLQRRKQSNRESARRSRSRKAAHLNELEAQVSQLRVENSSLLRRLADVNQKYNDAAVDNRVLKADVETLRAKVKMAEDTVKRATGMSTLFPAASDISSLSMPFNGSQSEATSGAAVSIQDDPNNYFAAANDGGVNTYMPELGSSTQVEDLINGDLAVGKMGRTVSLQRVASLEHLQKRICGGPTSSGSASWDSATQDPKGPVSKK